jgi:hypothetical protein
MLLNHTEMSARRDEHGMTTVWDPSEVKEIEWVTSTTQVSAEQCELGFWFYLAFMLLYNARTLYYTLHYLNDEHAVSYDSVLWQLVAALQKRGTAFAELCARVVLDRNPSLDGAAYGTLFGHALHAHRREIDQFLWDFCGSETWFELSGVRAMVELDLFARPFVFSNASLFQSPSVEPRELRLVSAGDRKFVIALPNAVLDWLGKNVEVGSLDGSVDGIVVLDHARDQLPFVPRKSDEDAGYFLTSLMVNVRSICPRFVAQSWAARR